MTEYNTNFAVELEKLYRLILDNIIPVGEQLQKIITAGSSDKLIIYTHDILNRLFKNINVLKTLKLNHNDINAYRIILRASTADLIECIYLMAIGKDERDKEIWRRELECVCTLRAWAEQTKKFYDNHNLGNIDLSLLKTTFTQFVDPQTNEFYKKDDHKKMATASMLDILVKKDICHKDMKQLYANYRLLSLTEHYSTLGRDFSYMGDLDHTLIMEIVKWLGLASTLICQGIDEYQKTGTIVFPTN